MASKQPPIANILCVNENCSHTVSSDGFSTLRGAFISGKVIRTGEGVLYVTARYFHFSHKSLINL